MSSDMYRFPCCGLVHVVKTHVVKPGDVRFLVWRPTDDPNKYQLAGDFTVEGLAFSLPVSPDLHSLRVFEICEKQHILHR